MRFKEKSIPPCRAGPPAPVHMTNFYLTQVGSRQNQLRSNLGGWLTSHVNTLSFLKEFLKKGEISPRRASPPNRASSLPYEQPLRRVSWDAVAVLPYLQI